MDGIEKQLPTERVDKVERTDAPQQLSEETRELLWRLMRFRMGTRAASDIPSACLYYLERGRDPVFESYEDAIEECRPLEVVERDKQSMIDAKKLEQFLIERFSSELLRRALVEKVVIDANANVIHMPRGNEYGLPYNDYFAPPALTEQIFSSLSPAQQRKFRDRIASAYSLSVWHETIPTLKGLYFFVPVILYHNDLDDVRTGLCEGKDPSSLAQEYLQEIPQEEREFVYLASMMGHEIGHHIYTFIMRKNRNLEKAWEAVIDRTGVISSYAGWYKKDPKYYEENFCEAVRIYIVSPATLPKEASDFLRESFPEIQSLLMAEAEKNDGEQEGLKLELTSAELELAPGYVPGKDGNPTVEQITDALRRELDIGPDFPIRVGQRKKAGALS